LELENLARLVGNPFLVLQQVLVTQKLHLKSSIKRRGDVKKLLVMMTWMHPSRPAMAVKIASSPTEWLIGNVLIIIIEIQLL